MDFSTTNEVTHDDVAAARTSKTVDAKRFAVATDESRDELLTEFGKDTLRDRYLLPGEGYQDLFARVAAAYADDELPASAKYLLAMHLLRPHLRWHELYAAPERPTGVERARQLVEQVKRLSDSESGDDDDRWKEAHTGEPWMRADAAAQLRASRRDALRDDKVEALLNRELPADYFWTLADPTHAGVDRARRLLESISAGEISSPARRWAAALARNNAVVTLDVAGGYPANKPARVVVDVRAADRVTVALYRVTDPQTLLAAAGQVGSDFVYRDYGLAAPEPRVRMLRQRMQRAMLARQQLARLAEHRERPTLLLKDRVAQWDVRVADLPLLPADLVDPELWDDGDNDDFAEPDADRYDDRNSQYRDRLDKRYRAENRPSTWRTDRVLEIPAEHLAKPGAYLLVVVPQGTPAKMQPTAQAVAPLLVEPLSMTLGRARDGVVAAVASPDSSAPAAGATLHAIGVAPTTADAAGVAFIRAYAAGDRPIVAHHDGRYAVGGFGDVFAGVYLPHDADDLRPHYARRQRLQRLRGADQGVASVYEDRHVLAAYTDRPTYRPGQTVNFKLIARTTDPSISKPAPSPAPGLSGRTEGALGGSPAQPFRADDYDLTSTLKLLPPGTRLTWTAVDPKNRATATGTLELNDFSTCAGSFKLPDSTPVGAYSLRIHIANQSREIPTAFAVKYYRRPNFELLVDGLPAAAKPGQQLSARLTGRYYFGKPLAAGKVETRLFSATGRTPLDTYATDLNADGVASQPLLLPDNLAPGKYHLVFTLTDDTHLAATRTVALEITGTAPAATTIAGLPLFARAGTALDVAVGGAAEVRVVHHGKDKSTDTRVTPAAGRARLTFDKPGWHTVRAGAAHAEIFIYSPGAAGQSALLRQAPAMGAAEEVPNPDRPRWVNLTNPLPDDDDEFDGSGDDYRSRYATPDQQVWALFSRHHASAGDTLPVLIYALQPRPRVLFTFEGRTVADYHLAAPAGPGPYHLVELPIRGRHAPNVYLRARTIGHAPGAAAHADFDVPQRAQQQQAARELKASDEDESRDPRWCRIDVADPAAASAVQPLTISLKTDKPAYQPGDRVTVSAAVTDAAGKPAEAELSLAAVDASVFSFGEQDPAAVARAFADPRPPRRYLDKSWRVSRGDFAYAPERRERLRKVMDRAQQMAQAMQKLAEQARAQASAEPAADANPDAAAAPEANPAPPAAPGARPVAQFPLPNPRTDFRETAAWLPQLRTDPTGRLTTTFTLPDSLTAYRLTAIGVTRSTAIGHTTASLLARKPLAVQLQLPRFAVENDQIELPALLHNTTDQPQTVTLTWKVEGLTPSPGRAKSAIRGDAPPRLGEGGGEGQTQPSTNESALELKQVDGHWLATTTLVLKPHSTTPTNLPASFPLMGRAAITLSAASATESDAEQRSFPILPLARPAEVRLSGQLDRELTLTLPKDFVPYDLNISMSRGDLARALDGLGYLVDYPYGCVEQTMSRFLPAVVVRAAVRDLPIELPPAVAEKLPDAIDQGLARLYAFQHDNGGWGWWEKDKTDDRMTLYVLTGLLRCRNSGVNVDASAIARAVDHVEARLGALPEPHRSAAHLALALAGKSDKPALAAYAATNASPVKHIAAGDTVSSRFVIPDTSRATLALACHAAGLPKPAAALAHSLRDWNPEDALGLSLKLSTQLATGADDALARGTASRLLLLRQGHRWDSTLSTSQSILALSDLLRHTKTDTDPVRSATITVANKPVSTLTTKEDLSKLTYRAHLTSPLAPQPPGSPAPLLFPRDQLPIQLRADADHPLHYAVTATGYQRLDDAGPTGDAVRITRAYTTADGQPVTAPLKPGDVVHCRLTLTLARPQTYLMIEDPRPALAEYADDRFAGPAARDAAHAEFRDDRACAFFSQLPAGQHTLTYPLRVHARGQVRTLPARAFPMYHEKQAGHSGTDKLEVR